jgi:hypothetical protein
MKTVSVTTQIDAPPDDRWQPLADGGWGIGDNFLTLTMHNEHDRTGGHRGAFGSYGAPIGTQ